MPDLSINPFPLGKIAPTPGSPLPLTNNFPTFYGQAMVFNDLFANKLEVTANAANGGAIYVGTKNMVKATMVGVIKILQPGQTWLLAHNVGLNKYHVGDFCIDVASAGDWAYASADVV